MLIMELTPSTMAASTTAPCPVRSACNSAASRPVTRNIEPPP